MDADVRALCEAIKDNTTDAAHYLSEISDILSSILNMLDQIRNIQRDIKKNLK
jgi:hypothetical protein